MLGEGLRAGEIWVQRTCRPTGAAALDAEGRWPVFLPLSV